MSGWIKIGDPLDLPPRRGMGTYSTRILICDEFKHVHYGYYAHCTNTWWDEVAQDKIKDTTHWSYLPEPPND